MMKKGTVIAAGVTAAFAAAPMALRAAQEGEVGLFSMNTGLGLWTLVVFLVVLFILSKYAWKPILGAAQAREEGIRSALDEARAQRDEAAALLARHQAQLADSRRQSQQILADAREAGETVRREIEEKARAEGEAMLRRARREIQREKDAVLVELRQESVDLALSAASRLIGEKLDSASDRALVERFLGDLRSEDRDVVEVS